MFNKVMKDFIGQAKRRIEEGEQVEPTVFGFCNNNHDVLVIELDFTDEKTKRESIMKTRLIFAVMEVRECLFLAESWVTIVKADSGEVEGEKTEALVVTIEKPDSFDGTIFDIKRDDSQVIITEREDSKTSEMFHNDMSFLPDQEMPPPPQELKDQVMQHFHLQTTPTIH